MSASDRVLLAYIRMLPSFLAGKTGREFQRFFEKAMTKKFPRDFNPVCPWGQKGDKKCDGYLPSQGILFQVYGPDVFNENRAIKKIREDFQGALDNWGGKFSTWAFVHNKTGGLPPDVQQVIIELGLENPDITIEPWSPDTLWEIAIASLNYKQLVELFEGPPLGVTDLGDIDFEICRVILENLKQKTKSVVDKVEAPPPEKIKINQLDYGDEQLLHLGYGYTPALKTFIENYPLDPELGDNAAAMLNKKYLELRMDGLPPSEIFSLLYEFVNLNKRYNLEALVVLAYFFEVCDIFESVPLN